MYEARLLAPSCLAYVTAMKKRPDWEAEQRRSRARAHGSEYAFAEIPRVGSWEDRKRYFKDRPEPVEAQRAKLAAKKTKPKRARDLHLCQQCGAKVAKLEKHQRKCHPPKHAASSTRSLGAQANNGAPHAVSAQRRESRPRDVITDVSSQLHQPLEPIGNVGEAVGDVGQQKRRMGAMEVTVVERGKEGQQRSVPVHYRQRRL